MQLIEFRENDNITNEREAAAFLLDFITALMVPTYVISTLVGGTYSMSGRMAVASAAIAIAYFIIGKYTGGTIWQRVCRMK